MNEKDFDLDFDFEKEYGFDTPETDPEQLLDEDFDLKALLESEFGEEAAAFTSEYESDFDYGPETVDYAQDEGMVLSEAPVEEEAAVPEEDYFDADLPEEMMNAQPLPQEEYVQPEEVPEEVPSEEPVPEEMPVQRPVKRERRKPVSPMRRFKNETLPLIIAGATAVLLLFFIGGSVGRLIGKIRTNNETALKASEAAVNEAERQDKEALDLLDEAALLAAGYDYDTAIAKLEGFTGNKAKYPEMEIRLSEYKQQKSLLVAHNDPGAIANLAFHVLVADPSRTWTNQQYGGQYNRNFVTTDEFERILEQLYNNGYVLVDMDSFIAETVTGETITYSSKPMYLPDGKKPIMITETMVNYFGYMIDGNNDGTPDKDGAGFASKLVVDDLTGQIQAEMVNASGETVRGDYDLVPVLEKFIDAHPDFSYRGARATLAVTGYEGIFGYRINSTVKNTKGEDYYNQEVEGAKKIVAALKDKGYEIACYTYGNINYGDKSASDIQADIASWKMEIMPVVGTLDTLVYAKSSDISTTGAYTGGKYNVLSEAGFRYFVSNGTSPSADVTNSYIRQKRLMVTGSYMAHTAGMYNSYFDAKTVLNSLRGNVPQG